MMKPEKRGKTQQGIIDKQKEKEKYFWQNKNCNSMMIIIIT